MEAWNEIHHIDVNDLVFALGLRGGKQKATKPTQGKKDGQRGTKQAGVGQSLAGDEDEHHLAPCKANFCMDREGQLEVLLERRVAVQEASVRAKRRRAVVSARAVASEAERDAKQEELEDILNSVLSGESTWQSLRRTLVTMKAGHTVLGEVLHDLMADRARQRREEAVDSMPAHLRRSLPSDLAEARRGLNFSSSPSRCARSSGRPKTVYAILEDGMPGGRLETRQGTASVGSPFRQSAFSVSPASLDEESFGVWPTTPPRCRLGTGAQFPPRQLAVSPIQSSASVGALLTLDENKINKRRDRQKARLRRRAKEWQKTAGSTGPEDDYDGGGLNNRFPGEDRHRPQSMTASDADLGRRRKAWGSPTLATSPSPPRSTLSNISPPPQFRRVIK